MPASGSASRKRMAGLMTPKSGSTSGRAGKSGLASARRGKGAKGTSSRGQLFQPTPEPMTPAHGVEATPAVRTSQRRGRGMKRLKAEQDGYELWSEEDGWEDQAESQEGDDDDSMEEWETTAREAAAVSFRDPTRNRRKPAKEVSTYSPSESPEPAPAPRDVSRNRRKGKAARAAGVMGAEPVKPVSSGGPRCHASSRGGRRPWWVPPTTSRRTVSSSMSSREFTRARLGCDGAGGRVLE